MLHRRKSTSSPLRKCRILAARARSGTFAVTRQILCGIAAVVPVVRAQRSATLGSSDRTADEAAIRCG